jgi:chemotaxis protein CheX
MPTEIKIGPHVDELAQIVGSVFETMLRLETALGEDAPPHATDMLTAAVYLTGNYRGAILIHCLPRQACAFAGQFLSKEAHPEINDEVRDVLGELANMIAGNLKCTFLPGTHLSIPSVIEGPLSALRVCGGQPQERIGFASGTGPFWISAVISKP